MEFTHKKSGGISQPILDQKIWKNLNQANQNKSSTIYEPVKKNDKKSDEKHTTAIVDDFLLKTAQCNKILRWLGE